MLLLQSANVVSQLERLVEMPILHASVDQLRDLQNLEKLTVLLEYLVVQLKVKDSSIFL